MIEKIWTGTLPNGLRVVHVPATSKVGFCGVAVGAGSRDEACGKYGLAHFVEHTIFKGTLKRRSWHILNRMESVGGEINAYTTKEETVVYSVFPAEHLQRAAELIADLVQNSQFPEAELDKERDVVLEEANSYLDSPADAVYDDFEDLAWKNSALGHNILGTQADLLTISGNDCRQHLFALFAPRNMVFFALGPMTTSTVIRTAERYFGSMNNALMRQQRVAPAPVQPFHIARNIDSHQAHTIYGAPIFSMHDERKYALSLLNNLLGGPGMNSLLNVAIRERRGYAYSVESSLAMLSDCGLITIYFGSDVRNVNHCLRIIANTIDKLANKPMSTRALDAAKKQFIGQLQLADDIHETQALTAAKSCLHFGHIDPADVVEEHIKAVSAADIMDMASIITPNNASTLSLH